VNLGQVIRNEEKADADEDQAIAKLNIQAASTATHVTALEEKLASSSSEIRQELDDILPRIAILEKGGSLEDFFKLNSASDLTKPTRSSSRPEDRHGSLRASANDEDLQCHLLAPSVWDGAIALGTEYAGTLGSALMGLALVLNVGVQLAFLSFLVGNLTEDPMPSSRVDELREWRYYVGHDSWFADPIDGSSLVSRVCSKDATLNTAFHQATILSLIEAYYAGIGYGFLDGFGGLNACILAVVCWHVTIGREVQRIYQSCRAIMQAPRDFETVFYATDGWHEVHSVSRRKVAFVLCLTTVRLGILLVLLYVGMQFLVYALSLSDLVLGAVALEFILRLDELFFKVMGPVAVRHMWTTLRPLHVRSVVIWGAEVHVSLFLLIIVVFATFSFVQHHKPFLERLDSAKAALCAGDLNFVYSVSAAGNMSWWPTPSGTSNPSHQGVATIVQQLIDGKQSIDTGITWQMNGFRGRASAVCAACTG